MVRFYGAVGGCAAGDFSAIRIADIFAQVFLRNLAHARQRQRVRNLQAFRQLEFGDLLVLQKHNELIERQRTARLERHEGATPFAHDRMALLRAMDRGGTVGAHHHVNVAGGE